MIDQQLDIPTRDARATTFIICSRNLESLAA